MRHVITGAGQIGTQLARSLRAQGHDVTVVRRRAEPVEGVRLVVGDAGDRGTLARAAVGADAIFHCIHAPYDRRAWERDLPGREQAVMDVAEAQGIPVVFPESVYAFGEQARDLREGATLDPTSALGEVRARLITAREEHAARAISVVASDVVGPTAGDGSVATATVIRPVLAGRRAYVPAALDAPHTWTYLPDLAAAMIAAARDAADLAPTGHRLLHAPADAPRSLRRLARDVAKAARLGAPRLTQVPEWPLTLTAPFAAMVRELHEQAHLRREPVVVRSGVLTEHDVPTTPWETAIRDTVRASSGRAVDVLTAT